GGGRGGEGGGGGVVLTRRERAQLVVLREADEHRLLEACVGPDAIGQCRQPGQVRDRRRRRLDGALTASAHAGAHRPPFMVSSSTPFSWKFGSLSRRATSARPSPIRSASSSPAASLPKRWKRVAVTQRTPAVACTTA